MIFCPLLFVGCGKVDVGTPRHGGAFLTVRETIFEVEVVDSLDKQIRGLSGRENLEENEGMLFVYNTSETRSFWMKDMKFGLDIIFIDNEVVVDLVEGLSAPVGEEEIMGYTSKETSDMVLEVNAGVVRDYGIEVGDRVDILW
ncbi:DUF192 domain-containing protein [Candidatus Falkowbacteria bacterium]|nr:DUF192 domain-containing protein [Candidatus Falkowbacteria bacterium]